MTIAIGRLRRLRQSKRSDHIGSVTTMVELIYIMKRWDNRKEKKMFIVDSIIAATIIIMAVVATILF
jgi:hypothetical protein